MTTKSLMEAYIEVQRVPEDECKDSFLDVGKEYIAAPATFGGKLIAQSIEAAQETIDDSFAPTSTQATFLKFGKPDVPATYRVERSADSKATAVRIVRAVQGDKVICVTIVRLSKLSIGHNKSATFAEYDAQRPDIGQATPDNLQERFTDDQLVACYFPLDILEWLPEQPCEWRVLPFIYDTPKNPREFTLQGMVRCHPIQTGRCSTHAAAGAWITDAFMPLVSCLACYASMVKAGLQLRARTTLQLNISFHDPTARLDEWMQIEATTSWGNGRRQLLEMRVWNPKTDKLILTASQEYMMLLDRPNL